MSPQLKEIEAQALLLPPEDREILVQVLVYSLENVPQELGLMNKVLYR
jgi:hypothetical protein